MIKESINWLLIFVVIVLAYYSFRGKRLGFVRTVFLMFTTIVTVITASVFAPYVSEWIVENEIIKDKIALLFADTISFVSIIIVMRIFLAVLCRSLDFITNIPVLSGLNRLAGFLLGFFHGLFHIWIWFAVLTIFSETETGKILIQYIEQSSFLTTIYSQNLLIKIFI